MDFAQACMCDRTPFLKEPGIACKSTKSVKIVLCLIFVLEFDYKVIIYLKVLFYYLQSHIFFTHFFDPLYFLVLHFCALNISIYLHKQKCFFFTLINFWMLFQAITCSSSVYRVLFLFCSRKISFMITVYTSTVYKLFLIG